MLPPRSPVSAQCCQRAPFPINISACTAWLSASRQINVLAPGAAGVGANPALQKGAVSSQGVNDRFLIELTNH